MKRVCSFPFVINSCQQTKQPGNKKTKKTKKKGKGEKARFKLNNYKPIKPILPFFFLTKTKGLNKRVSYPSRMLHFSTHSLSRLTFRQDTQSLGSGPQQPSDEHNGWQTWPMASAKTEWATSSQLCRRDQWCLPMNVIAEGVCREALLVAVCHV